MNHDQFEQELNKTLDYLLDGRINKDDAVRGIMHDIKPDHKEPHPDNSERAEEAVRNLVRALDNNGLAESDVHYLQSELSQYLDQFKTDDAKTPQMYQFSLSIGIRNNPTVYKQETTLKELIQYIQMYTDNIDVRGADIEDDDPALDEENFLDIHIEKVDPDE